MEALDYTYSIHSELIELLNINSVTGQDFVCKQLKKSVNIQFLDMQNLK